MLAYYFINQPSSLRRSKRQAFKPTVDGNILGNERKLTLLRNTKTLTSNALTPTGDSNAISTTNMAIFNASSVSNEVNIGNGTMKTNEITVTSLSLSLINLFDRVKGTLCQIIGQTCL